MGYSYVIQEYHDQLSASSSHRGDYTRFQFVDRLTLYSLGVPMIDYLSLSLWDQIDGTITILTYLCQISALSDANKWLKNRLQI